ncbi:MAG: ROK family protein [Chloroflexota bacterium]
MEEEADSSILAIDLGGTQIRAAHVRPDLTVSHRAAVATDDEAGVAAVVRRICELVAEVRADARAAGAPDPIGIGISAPGPLDPWRGIVVAPPNLTAWRNVPLARIVEERIGLPTFLERDTNVAVQCEWRYGAARGANTAIYFTISTGIGGGIILDGRPLLGRDGTAGEVGHLTVELDGPICGDGQRGHVEAIASGTAIARSAREALDDGRAPGLAALVRDGAAPDAATVARAADEGDTTCAAILDRAWEALGAMAASVVNALNPDVIVLGGGIAANRPEVLERVRRGIEQRAFPAPAARVRVALAEHGDDVSLIGSLPIVHDRIHDPAFRRATPVRATATGAATSQRSSMP